MKLMNKKIIYTSLAAFTFLATSCLDLEPKDQLSDANLWDKPGDFQSFANQMYGWTNSYNEIVYSAGPHGDKRSDILCDKGGYNTFSNGQNVVPAGSSLSTGNYNSFYSHIRRCNILISRAEEYTGSLSDITQPLGEAYFFRAYVYYELLTIYGDAIIVDHVLDTDDPLLYAKRDDRLDVANFIINDLHNAAGYLKPLNELEEGRVSKEAARAFLSRVALYEASWQKFHKNNITAANTLYTEAMDAANEIIGKFSLFYNASLGTESYRYLFILEDAPCNPAGATKSANKEFIFSRCYNAENPINRNITKETFANAQMATRKFVDLFLCQDGLPIETSKQYDSSNTTMDSEWKNRDNRMSNILMQPHGTFWNNDAGSSRTSWDENDRGHAYTTNFIPSSGGTGYYTHKYSAERQVTTNYESYDYPIIRYAEVLLNYAEAAYERDGQISDEDLARTINRTRKRVNPQMPDITNAFISGNNLDMRTEIRRERTIELFNEGFRIDDLKRWKTAETEMPMDLCGVTFSGEYAREWIQNTLPLNSNGQVIYERNRQWQQKNYLYPLPSDQLQLNPNLGQNPGW
ncbi:MAG: RagB/SusD family nutrient uptake outer membrane protein [Muribaculaceae bacterium]|nr:RagB/SusD family nutrient uptake outer membrane protein [Muribaculaceae bacterium]